jgi:hypothetical protein
MQSVMEGYKKKCNEKCNWNGKEIWENKNEMT